MPSMGNRRAALILLMILCSFFVSFPVIEMVKAEADTIVVPADYVSCCPSGSGHLQTCLEQT